MTKYPCVHNWKLDLPNRKMTCTKCGTEVKL